MGILLLLSLGTLNGMAPLVGNGPNYLGYRRQDSREDVPTPSAAFTCANVAAYEDDLQRLTPDKRVELRRKLQPWVRPDGYVELGQQTAGAVLVLALAKDRESGPILRGIVKRMAVDKNRGKLFIYIWAVFWIEQDDSIPFLLDCLQYGQGYQLPALACLARLSFTTKPDTRGDASQIAKEWSAWWAENRTKNWNRRLLESVRAEGVQVEVDGTGEITLGGLIDLSERFPLRASESRFIDNLDELPKRQTHIAMRVAELLCERTGVTVTPRCFPLGHPDSSLPRYNAGKGFDWRKALAQQGIH